MRIAVTGATGFLGGRVARMASGRGHAVTALGRDAGALSRLSDSGMATCASDLADRRVMSGAFAGADVVVHCAAMGGPWGPRAAYERANVEGTRNVVDACARAGVGTLVHVSTSSVCFAFADRIGIRESDPLPSPVNAYADTKARAELIAMSHPGRVAVLRPRGIHGPGDTTLLPRMLRALRKGPVPLLRGGEAVIDVTHVDVVADAVLAACERPLQGIHNVGHGEGMSVRHVIESVAAAAGLRPRWIPVPVPLTLAGARMAEAVAAALPGRPEPPATAYSLGLLAFSQTLDVTAIRASVGWVATEGAREGLSRTLRELGGR